MQEYSLLFLTGGVPCFIPENRQILLSHKPMFTGAASSSPPNHGSRFGSATGLNQEKMVFDSLTMPGGYKRSADETVSLPPGSFSVSGSITIAAWHYPLPLPVAWRIQRTPPIDRGRAGRP